MTARRSSSRRRPDSLGSVEQLPSGRFRAYYSRDGERFTAPHTFATRAAAQDWLAAERADRARGTWLDPRAGRITLADYARDLLDARTDLSPRYRDASERLLSRWIATEVESDRGRRIELGRLHLGDLTTADIRAWYGCLRDAARRSALRQLTPSAPLPASRNRAEHPARTWARSQGMPVSPGGRMPRAMLAAWHAAGSPSTSAPRYAATTGSAETFARAWAISTGREVARAGRVPRAIVDAWRKAGSPRPAAAAGPRAVAPEHAGETTAAGTYRLLHMILATAQRDGLIPTNPCNLPGAGRATHRPRGIANPAEVDALAAAMPRQLAAAVHLAAWSGLRYGELFGLTRRHVDLDAGTVRVERTLQLVRGAAIGFGKTKTAGSLRTVHLPAFVADMLAEHLAEHVADDPDALLFTTSAGTAVSSAALSHVFRRARLVVGREDLTWHDLRHTGATLAYRAGASVPEVQARLGHTTMRAANLYAHIADDSDRTLAERMDALYGDRDNGSRRHLRAV